MLAGVREGYDRIKPEILEIIYSNEDFNVRLCYEVMSFITNLAKKADYEAIDIFISSVDVSKIKNMAYSMSILRTCYSYNALLNEWEPFRIRSINESIIRNLDVEQLFSNLLQKEEKQLQTFPFKFNLAKLPQGYNK